MVMDRFTDFIYVFVEIQVLVEPDSETLNAVTGHNNTFQMTLSTCCCVPMNNISDLDGFKLRPLWLTSPGRRSCSDRVCSMIRVGRVDLDVELGVVSKLVK